MKIKIDKDLKKFALTSTLTKDDILLAKKYRPAALKKQDKDGNDVFAVSYVEGRPCLSANGVTFGAASHNGGYALITGDLPDKLPGGCAGYGEYVADMIGAALPLVNEFEAAIPAVVSGIKAERTALLESIVEA